MAALTKIKIAKRDNNKVLSIDCSINVTIFRKAPAFKQGMKMFLDILFFLIQTYQFCQYICITKIINKHDFLQIQHISFR